MNEAEIIQFIKENLTVEVSKSSGFYGENEDTVQLFLCGEVISECYLG